MSEELRSTIQFEVRGFDCGYGGPLRIFALANFLQEAAGVNATALGFGMEDMQSKGRTWMLSRLELRVDELPRDGDRIVVRTWPAGSKRLFAMRAMELLRPEGALAGPARCLARAVYAYLIVDISARRPLRPESVFSGGMIGASEALPISDYSFDIPEATKAVLAFTQGVSGRHIDHNGHANNAHIINWLVDAACPPGRYGQGPALAALRVEFAAEALEGDLLRALRGEPETSAFPPGIADSQTVSELVRGDATVARALGGWR